MFKPVDYNKNFVIGTPLVAWKADRNEHMYWLHNAKDIQKTFPNAVYFAALELDHRGIEPFKPMVEVLKSVGGTYWTYTIDDRQEFVTSGNRWIRIETGRNLIREFAQRKRAMSGNHWGEPTKQDVVNFDAILYIDSDNIVTSEIIEKMFEIDRPLVGVDVPAYGLSGTVVNEKPRIEEHWNTAGMLLVNAPAYYDLPWYHNAFLNLSDDPSFQSMASRLKRRIGTEEFDDTYGMTWVRKDVSSSHKGELIAVEKRKIPNRELSN